MSISRFSEYSLLSLGPNAQWKLGFRTLLGSVVCCADAGHLVPAPFILGCSFLYLREFPDLNCASDG